MCFMHHYYVFSEAILRFKFNLMLFFRMFEVHCNFKFTEEYEFFIFKISTYVEKCPFVNTTFHICNFRLGRTDSVKKQHKHHELITDLTCNLKKKTICMLH